MGFNTNDDAGVYRLSDDMALVLTTDFITPPVNDPYLFGQIAAANAPSDIYAMGAQPKVCLNLVCFPSRKLPPQDLDQIVAGALTKITEAGAVLAGGHSVEDDEPKFGLSVAGVVHPEKYWTNAGAKPGDLLVLTKPLGSGVLFNANLKQGRVSEQALSACLEALTTLNRKAAEAMRAFDIHAVTDVSGFGLAGHALEMAKASGVAISIEMQSLPIMDQALAMYRKGVTTGVNAFNKELVARHMVIDKSLGRWHQEIIYDPQTSGGLLVALPAGQAPQLIRALQDIRSPAAALIGKITPLDGTTHLNFGLPG